MFRGCYCSCVRLLNGSLKRELLMREAHRWAGTGQSRVGAVGVAHTEAELQGD